MNKNGGGVSLATANSLYRAVPTIQNATPTAGQTVNITATSSDVVVWLTPAGTLATLTIALPSDGSTQIGQIIRVSTNQLITLLTVNGATNLFNLPTTLALGGNFNLLKVAANTWVRVQ